MKMNMNMRRALLLASAAINVAVAQLNNTTSATAIITDAPSISPIIASNETISPSSSPTFTPSISPSISPTSSPSSAPSSSPSNSPSGSPSFPPTSAPTNSPTNSPTMKTDPPSAAPSLSPSRSNAPSAPPTVSLQPTPVPTVSFQPTASPSASPSAQPTQSNYPSFAPTISAAPTGTPSDQPTAAPIIPPSAAPSMEEVVEVLSEYEQKLEVTENFDTGDMERFCRIYKLSTNKFGLKIGEPQISTKCTVAGQYFIQFTQRSLWQRLRRMLQEEPKKYELTVNFFMKYSTVIGVYDLENYNALFASYVNSNLTTVLLAMKSLQLPVLNVTEVVELEDISPTNEPTKAPQTEAPAARTMVPSSAPTSAPVVVPDVVNQGSFVMGLSLGLSGAFVIAAIGFIYYRHVEKRKHEDFKRWGFMGDSTDLDGGKAGGVAELDVNGSDQMGVLSQDDSDNDDGAHNIEHSNDGGQMMRGVSAPMALGQSSSSAFDVESGTHISASVGATPGVHPLAYATMDSIFSQQVSQQSHGQLPYQETFRGGAPTNFMMADASFSSDSDDDLGNPSAFDGSNDELDNYKNRDLEMLRNTVEEAVDDVEGMLSLAMTQALTEGDDTELPWGSEDNGSIEASCLFETYDWLKRNEESPLDTRNEFFQEVMNGIVITVMYGLMHPLEAAQLAHGVATVIGIPLLKELSKKTLVITGMRKTTDVDRGQNDILAAFERFGPIEQAAIAPNNRGFGFVRFSKPKSVQRALEKYRVGEIEIQNVSVSIKTLECTVPARD